MQQKRCPSIWTVCSLISIGSQRALSSQLEPMNRPAVLLTDLNQHVARHQPETFPGAERKSRRPIYPLFLVTGLAVALLAGFTTGIIALSSAAIGWPGLGVNWLILVQTHGRIQLYGFAALFVFGVAYHVIPRFVAAPLRPSYAPIGTYIFTTLGVGLGVFQIFGDERSFVVDHALFTAGLAFLAIASVLYAVTIYATVGGSEQPKELAIRFVQAAALWLVLGSSIELIVGVTPAPGQSIPPQMEEPALAAVLLGFLL